MSITQDNVRKEMRVANQNKDLLINVRAKAFELQTVLSDLIEFDKTSDFKEKAIQQNWMELATQIYNQTGKRIKGA